MPQSVLRIRVVLLVIAGVCLAETVWSQEAGDKDKAKPAFVPKITISKETTYFTEPVRPDGFVNYLAALNRHFSRGVTPENNACVLLYHAMGPAPEGGKGQQDRFFELLGMERPRIGENTFQSLGNWWQQQAQPKARDAQGAYDQQGIATSRPWTSAEFPDIAKWLRDSESPLRTVIEATDRSEYYSPVDTGAGDDGQLIMVLLPGVQASRELARALTARAMHELAEGSQIDAWRDLIAVHRLGRLVGRGGTLIEGLVGVAIESVAIEAELRLLSDTRPSTKLMTLYAKQLQRLPARSAMADKIDICERAMFLDSCHHLARGQMKLNDLADGGGDQAVLEKILEAAVIQSVNWDEILKQANQRYDRIVAAARQPGYRERTDSLRKMDEELKELVRKRQGAGALLVLLGGKQAVTQFTGDVLISLLLPAVRQSINAEHRIMQRMRNLDIAMALATWRGEHDSYPDSLADLSPKHLATVPNDLFNDRPLRYERTAEGYRFYSVGENETDDGGRSFDDVPRGDDLIVQTPKPQPKPNR